MKAKDLMVGDWIKLGKKKIHKCYNVCGHTNDVSLDNGVFTNVMNLEPIPLTAEILEKNGFERVGTSYILKESMFELTNPSHPDRYQDNYYVRIARQNKRIMYVHNLQHIMKEFGIEKEIEL